MKFIRYREDNIHWNRNERWDSEKEIETKWKGTGAIKAAYETTASNRNTLICEVRQYEAQRNQPRKDERPYVHELISIYPGEEYLMRIQLDRR